MPVYPGAFGVTPLSIAVSRMPAFQFVILLLKAGQAGRTKTALRANSGPGEMKMDSAF